RQRLIGAAHLEAALAQQRERLRRCHLMNEVQIDVKHRRGVRGLWAYQMRFPHFFEERLCCHASFVPLFFYPSSGFLNHSRRKSVYVASVNKRVRICCSVPVSSQPSLPICAIMVYASCSEP